jgi:hypothetical protein
MKKISKVVSRLSIEKRAEVAFKVAVRKAINEHIRLGLPVYVWRDGKIIAVRANNRPKGLRKREQKAPR